MTEITRLDSRDPGFRQALDTLLTRESEYDQQIATTVGDIIADIRARGDTALVELTRRLDRWEVATAADLEIPLERCRQALQRIPPEQGAALELAAERIRTYAGRQVIESWSYTEADGTRLGQRVTPLDRAGLYVPGGKAAYPSSVLMNAIPAKVAGVPELFMVVPTPGGEHNDMVLAAARRR
jgi:histidinol dehydrogenase